MKTNIHHRVTVLLTLAVGLAAGTVTAQNAKKVIAVGTVQTTSALAEDMAQKGKTIEMRRVVEALDRHYINALVQTRKFTIVGRSDLKDLLKEQDLGDSGLVDAGTSAEKGKIKGAEFRQVVTVDSFLEENTDAAFASGRKATKRRFQLSAQSITYNASTGEALDSSNFQVEKMDVLDKPDGQVSDAKRTDELMPALAKEMAEKVAARTVDVLYPAKILDVEDKVVTINRGDTSGIQIGQIWNVFGPAKTVTDPDSGEVIKRKGANLGRVKITSVDPTYSQGEIIEDRGIVAGSIVSPPGKALVPVSRPAPKEGALQE